jgi:hypothetical protein
MSVQVEKKPFPEDRAAKLALAREKALEVRRKNKEMKMRAELEKMETARTKKDDPPPDPVVEKEIESIGHTEVDLEEEGLAEDEIEPATPQPATVKKVVKKKPKKQQVVIVEQSDDDSDEFESQPNVVFVKRTKPKKKEPPPPPQEPQVAVAQLPPPSPPKPPPKPQLTPEQMQVQSFYHNMFNGNFAMQPRRR